MRRLLEDIDIKPYYFISPITGLMILAFGIGYDLTHKRNFAPSKPTTEQITRVSPLPSTIQIQPHLNNPKRVISVTTIDYIDDKYMGGMSEANNVIYLPQFKHNMMVVLLFEYSKGLTPKGIGYKHKYVGKLSPLSNNYKYTTVLEK